MLQVKFLSQLRTLGFEAEAVDREKGLDRSQGTAFLVSREGHLLTCAHVLGAHEQATVWLAGTNHEARVVRRDEMNDLALLKVSMPAGQLPAPIPAALSTNYPLGQDVFTIGFPLTDILGSSPRLTKGLISAAVGLNDDPKHLQVSVEIQPGNSGGPLLNDRGEFVGIIGSSLSPMRVLTRTGGSLPQNVNFAVKGTVVRDFLERAEVRPAVRAGDATPLSFDAAKDSVALVTAGAWTPEKAAPTEMICRIVYAPLAAREMRFRYFAITFYDLKSGNGLFRTGMQAGERDDSEEGVMKRATEEIRKAFFPAPSSTQHRVTP